MSVAENQVKVGRLFGETQTEWIDSRAGIDENARPAGLKLNAWRIATKLPGMRSWCR